MIHGFKLVKKEELNEINSIGELFYHEKSGAKLFHINNSDNNKLFSISFKTPVDNDKGIPHILEHCILRGYRNSPGDDILSKLNKGTVGNYFDAITFQDRTMYSFSTKNEVEFIKFADIFMNTLFYSDICSKRNIFLQEGWRVEYNEENDNASYNGIVLNEMRNKFTNPKIILNEKIKKSLFRNSPYRFKADGVPCKICESSHEDIIKFYRQYYTPCNSYIYLYGKVNLDEILGLLNDNYLCSYTKKQECDHSIPLEQAFLESKEVYNIHEINCIKKNILSLNFVVGTSTDIELCMIFDILKNILAKKLFSKLKDKYYGNISCTYNTLMLQPIFSIIVENFNKDTQRELISDLFNVLKDIAYNGIDENLIKIIINKKKIELSEIKYSKYPLGMQYNLKYLKSWIYNDDPFIYFKYINIIDKIIKSPNKYFRDAIEKYLLNNYHRSIVVLIPSCIDDTEYANINKDERKYFEKNNIPKEKNTGAETTFIDMGNPISIKDINTIPEIYSIIKKNYNNVEVLEHHYNTNEIIYIDMFFDLHSIPKQFIPYINVLANMIGNTNTKNHTYSEIWSLTHRYTDGIYCSAEVYADSKIIDKYYGKLVIRTKCLRSNLIETISLLNEVIININLNNKEQLKAIIRKMKYKIESYILNKGQEFIGYRVISYFSPLGVYRENLKGLNFYTFIKYLENSIDEDFEKIISTLQHVKQLIFNKNNLIVSVTGRERDCKKFEKNSHILLDSLNKNNIQYNNYSFELCNKNEGVISTNRVQSLVKAYNFRYLNYLYTGHIKVLETMLNSEYFYDNIRVKGGAYAFSSDFQRNGIMFLISYCDSNFKNSLNTFNNSHSYIRNISLSQKRLEKYIINTFKAMDLPLTPYMKGLSSTINYICNVSCKDINEERNEIANTSIRNIKELSNLLYDCMNKSCFCVLGNEETINSNKSMFDSITRLY